MVGTTFFVLYGILGETNKGLGKAQKSARGRSMKARPTQSRKGVKGDFVPFRLPLAGSRDSVPCGVWGNAPTVPRPTNPKEPVNKGAGSEASLPVTLRVRRRAPKLLFPQDSVMNLFFGRQRSRRLHRCAFPCSGANQATKASPREGNGRAAAKPCLTAHTTTESHPPCRSCSAHNPAAKCGCRRFRRGSG